MKIGRWAKFMLVAAPLLAGCGDFWQAPNGSSSTSFTLSSSPTSLTVSPGAASGNTSTITVTPGSSFTGTVALTCAITTSPSGATSPTTCSLSSSSLTFSSTTAQTATLTAATTATTTTGAYDITVTGVSGSITETATVCVEVGSGTCSAPSTTSGDFYILNGGTSGSVAGYSISSNTLTRVGSQVSLAGLMPTAMAIAPNGKFLCVSTSSGVYSYPITNGALGTGVQVTQDVAYSIQIDSTDSWLIEAVPYVGGSGGVTLNAVNISPTAGTYILNSAIPSATVPIAGATLPYGQMVISGDNSNVFVALETGGTIVVPFSSSNPFPAGVKYTQIPVANTGGSALSVGVDPGSSPRLFYIGEVLGTSGGTSGGLRAITYASLSTPPLVQANGSPIASGGLAPGFILPVATPDYVYVADGAGTITGFEITVASGTYTISTGSTVSAGDQPAGMAVDSTGDWVFEVGSSGSPYFDAYTFDSSTVGQLDSQITSTSAATSIAIVAAP